MNFNIILQKQDLYQQTNSLLHSFDYSMLKHFLEIQHVHFIYIDSDKVSNFSNYIRKAYDFKLIGFKELDELEAKSSVNKNLV